MHQASVGFQCPECVKGSTQRVITARSLQAGPAPVLTMVLIAVNVAVFVVSTLGVGGSPLFDPSRQFTFDWATVGDLSAGFGGIGVAHGEYYRLVTGGFLHGSLMHIAFNMFVLYVLGRQLESAIGTLRFAAVYGSSMLAGSLGVMLLDPGAFTVGASGAVFGLFGYAVVAQFSRGINPMDTGLGGIVLLNLLFTFAVPGISIGGHLGGLIGGAVVGAIGDLVQPRLKLPPVVGTVAMIAVGAVCAGASIAVVS